MLFSYLFVCLLGVCDLHRKESVLVVWVFLSCVFRSLLYGPPVSRWHQASGKASHFILLNTSSHQKFKEIDGLVSSGRSATECLLAAPRQDHPSARTYTQTTDPAMT